MRGAKLRIGAEDPEDARPWPSLRRAGLAGAGTCLASAWIDTREEEKVMTMQQGETTAFEIPWKGSGPALLPAYVGRSRVLVAEDDDDLRGLLRDELCRDGLEVVDCASAREAVRRREWVDAMAGNPWSLDVVVTDVYLGEIDGLSLLQGVAEAGLDVPVVLISAFGDTMARARAGELGAAAFIDKPLEMRMLRNLVDQLARERQRRVRARAQGPRQREHRQPSG